MTFLLETTFKISIVVGVGLIANVCVRTRSAAVRHWVLAAAVLCATSTPLVSLVGPSWSLPIAAVRDDRPRSSHAPRILATPRDSQSTSAPPSSVAPPATSYQRTAGLLFVAWLTGVVINLAILFAGLLQLTWLGLLARHVVSGPWAELTSDVSRLHGLRRPVRLLQSDHPSLLVTWGLFIPKIMLPAGADLWTADRIQIVVSHEIAHIRRGDWLIQMVAELLRSLNWFNPLLWLVCSRLREESERACDDAVVSLGVEGKEYATHLLELARMFGRQRRLWLAAPAIAPRPSRLERRISAMLNSGLNRRPLTPLVRALIVMALVGVTLPVAGFAQNSFATLSGSAVDQLNGVLPAVSVVVTDTQRQVKHQVSTDRAGRFEFVGLPQGDYLLEATIPGFKTLQARLTLAGQDMEMDLRLQLGSLQETITVTDRRDDVRTWPTYQHRPVLPECPPVVSRGMGGNVRQPRKLRHVSPLYPDGKLEGIVRLDTLIGTDGLIKDVRVVSSPHPDLTRAAVDAVRQWEFDETLLNCVPVETEMSVTIDFRRQK